MSQAAAPINPYRCTKTSCDRYEVRVAGKSDWAIFMIDTAGVFQCTSDYGDFSHNWPHHGRKSFKHFLVELARDQHYVFNKLEPQRQRFLFDETIESWKRHTLERRREGSITKERAREAMDVMLHLNPMDEPRELLSALLEEHDLSDVFGDSMYLSETLKHDWSCQIYQWWDKLFLPFCEELKKELQEAEDLEVSAAFRI